jgi:hypothetical protein
MGDLAGGLHQVGLEPLQRAHLETDVIEDCIYERQLGRRGPSRQVNDALQFLQVGAASQASEGIGRALDRLLQLMDVMRRFVVMTAVFAFVVTVVPIAVLAIVVLVIVVIVALVFAIVLVAALVMLVVVVVLVLVFSCHDISPQ